MATSRSGCARTWMSSTWRASSRRWRVEGADADATAGGTRVRGDGPRRWAQRHRWVIGPGSLAVRRRPAVGIDVRVLLATQRSGARSLLRSRRLRADYETSGEGHLPLPWSAEPGRVVIEAA